jgi:ACT domain-containing protein
MRQKLIILLIITATVSAHAQLKIHAGGGVNYSNIIFTNLQTPELNTATNYFLSVRPEIGVTENLSAVLDIQLSRKGYFFYEDSTFANGSGYRFQFLDLIPQVQYKIIKPVAIFGGLGIGIRTSEKQKIKDVWNEAIDKISRSADYTYVAGIRIFPLHKLSIHAQFAGTLGSFLQIAWTDPQGSLIPDVSTKLNNIQVGIAYQIF